MPFVTNPVIIQSDRSVLLEVHNPLYEDARVVDVLAVRTEIQQLMGRYGLVKLVREEDKLFLAAEDSVILLEIIRHKEVKPLLAVGESNDAPPNTS